MQRRIPRYLSKRYWYGLAVLLLLGSIVALPQLRAKAAPDRPWMNAALTPDERADQLIAQMTLDEKIALVHGVAGPYVGYVPANTRLGIPALNLSDGPAGVGNDMGGVTALPAPIAASASWDTSLMNTYGQTIGNEQANKGTNIALAPTVNILRVPQWGRSFESLGEDPYLSSEMGVADVQGIQSQGVIATVKHYAANNQEENRGGVSANVDERTLQEIYYPAFQAAVTRGQAGAVMCSYNLINTIYACENPYLLNQALRQQWGFPGFVVSDWGATHSTVAAANSGLDMEMWDGAYFGDALKTAVLNGQVSTSTLNTMVHRILRSMFAAGLFDHAPIGSRSNNVTTPAHDQFAQHADEQGAVLLKNNQSLLPLDPNQTHSIAVIGPGGSTKLRYSGGGSAAVIAPFLISPLQGITNRAGSNIKVSYAQGTNIDGDLPALDTKFLTPPGGGGNGLKAEFFNNQTLSGNPVLTRTDPNIDFNWNGGSPGAGLPSTSWSARWTGTLTAPATGSYAFSTLSDDGSRLYINDQLIIDNWRDQWPNIQSGSIQLTAGQSYSIRVEYYQNWGGSRMTLGWNAPGEDTDFNKAVQLAKSADVAVVVASDNEAESSDRPTLSIPDAQEQLVEAVTQANPHTVVVLNTGAPVLMPWVNQAQSILETWYPGQEDGNALASLLFGDVNPSGKLPMTFPASPGDVPANTPAQYPGINNQAQYSEGVFVGYRHYDQNNITPLFPFGYGLSYTTFSYSNLSVSPATASPTSTIAVSLDVTNTGARAGAEVVQLYLGMPSTNVSEPPKQLKGFQKVMLQPGQSQHVSFSLAPQAFSYWDVNAHNWLVQNGTYQVMIGSSSRDIRQQGSFDVSGSPPPPPPPPANSAIRINAGGGAINTAAWFPPFQADSGFSGGTVSSGAASIDLSGVSNPAPPAVYQSNRAGNFSYTLSNLTANKTYTVQLDFAETYWTKSGQRVFNVTANGQTVLSNFDIVAAAGGPGKAVAKPLTITADGSGTITLQFTTVVDNAQVNGIEIFDASSPPPPTPTPTPPPGGTGVQINAGGAAATPFVADTGFTGGATATSGNTIDTSAVSNPAPQTVYQSNRYGNFSYIIANLTPNKAYTVRLHFAETYWTQTGQRIFNVSANGQNVLSNFDIVATAGAGNKAAVTQANVTADGTGTITLQFSTVKDNAQVNGIEVLS